ncbi:MAG: tetratricopeptide repeat protein [Synergistaceae bacterium]|nr:tetratricopeptide repeat protein [Synergistaceae bacterium]
METILEKKNVYVADDATIRQPTVVKKDFFISYNKNDEVHAKWIAGILEENGYETYIQAWDFRPGCNFTLEMHKAAEYSEKTIIVLSTHYLESEYCQPEWTAAFCSDPTGAERKLIPIRIADVKLTGLLKSIIYIDLFNKNEEEAKKAVLEGVQKEIPRTKPLFPSCEIPQNNQNCTNAVKIVDNEKKAPTTPAKCVTRSKPLPASQFFCGRDEKIAEIINELEKESRIHLSAMGGMGKSEICRRLFHDAEKEGLPGIEAIGWLNFNESISMTFYDQIEELPKLDDSEKPDNYFLRVKKYLREQGSKLLLFIDNADELSEKDIDQIFELDCKVVITSRIQEINRIKPIDIDPLYRDDCIELYKIYSRNKGSAADDKVLKIIELAGRHTLTIELLGKTQYASKLSEEELLIRLHDKGFDLSGITEKINYKHDRGHNEADDVNSYKKTFMEHLLKVFDIAGITDEEQLKILRLFSLLPQLAVSGENTKKWFELENLDKTNELQEKGWLQESTDFEDRNGYSMHPVLASVIKHKLGPTCENSSCLIKSLASALIYEVTEVFTKALPVLQHAKSVADYFYDIEDKSLDYSLLTLRISGIYNSLGNYPAALHYIKKDLDISEKVLGKEHPSTATTYNNIAVVYDNQGDYAKALEWYQKALYISEKVLGKEHPSTATTYNNIAGVYKTQGDYAKALEWYQKALYISEKVLGKEHPSTATTYNNIAGVYKTQGDYAKALEWYQKALYIREKVLGKEHPSTATTYNNIAAVYNKQGDYAKALEWYQKALDIREKVLGKEHPSTATTYNNIAGVYSKQGDYAKALEWYQKALDICEKILGKEHPLTAATYNNIAVVYKTQGDYAKALEWYQKALDICEKVLGKEHPDTAVTYYNIAFVYNKQGDYAKALEWLQKALYIREKVLGKEHPLTATTYNNIAGVYSKQGDYAKALEWYQKALDIREKVLGKEHPSTATTYNNIAFVYSNQGDYTKALEWYQKALDIREKVLGKEHPYTAATYNNIAGVYDNQGDYAKALEWYQKALDICEKVLGKEHPDTATTYNNIAGVYKTQGDYAKALEWYQKALDIREKVLGKEHPSTATTYNNIAGVYDNQGDYAKAHEWYQKALDIYEKVLGKEHPYTATIYNNIAGVCKHLKDYANDQEWRKNAMKTYENLDEGHSLKMTVLEQYP